MRDTGKTPKESAAQREQERKNQEFGSGHALRAAFAVIPGQHEREEKPDARGDDERPLNEIRPRETLRDDIDTLEQRKGRRYVRYRPLHQLALLQALQEFVHGTAFFSLMAFDSSKD